MKRKTKKHIKINIIFFLLLIIFSLIKIVPYFIDYDGEKLKDLHYSKNAISEMKKYDISKEVINKGKYSKTLEEALIGKQFIKDNIDLYYSVEYQNDTNFIKNINKLNNTGYNKTQILLISKYLNNDAITILNDKNFIPDIDKYIVFDYFKINNIDRYLSYKEKKHNLSYDNIITNVNIGLDYPFYVNTKEVTNLNSITILVNKYNKLPSTYVPNNLVMINSKYATKNLELVKEARDAFEKLCYDASKEGLVIKATSTYRSYSYQADLYNLYVKKDGVNRADTYSARPGYSEHQTGLAIDISGDGHYLDDFINTEEFTWVSKNLYKYGFIIRYPKDKSNITGYKYEPWHLRYVGTDIATYIYKNNITYDEYYGKLW
jgi:LAS superfamily LD-carboxypeptidase LdcB